VVSVGVVKIIKTIVIKIVKTVKTAGSWSCIYVEVRVLLLLLFCCVAVTDSNVHILSTQKTMKMRRRVVLEYNTVLSN
jgi:flagellar biosynthesis protein FlhB